MLDAQTDRRDETYSIAVNETRRDFDENHAMIQLSAAARRGNVSTEEKVISISQAVFTAMKTNQGELSTLTRI